jgi:methyl-accepting chemotaxis protein
LSHGVASEFDRSMNKASYVDDTPVPVIVMDCEHTIEFMNPAAALLAGVSPESSVGMKLWDFFANDACRNGSCIAARAMREGHSIYIAGEYQVKGKTVPVRAYASPRYDLHNKLIGVVQVIEENSEEALFADEISRLVKASLDGQLSERGKSELFQGRYRDLMAEINSMLDAVIGPLHVTAGYVDRISKGDIPETITDNYNGDFNLIKNNLNQCIAALSGLVQQMGHMSSQHDLGDIDVVMTPESFHGVYRTMAEGVNKMVTGHISVKKKAMACIAEFGHGNFEAELERFPGKKAFINENIERLRRALKEFIADMDRMSNAHNAGDIDAAIPEEQFEGSYRTMAKGVNEMVQGHISVKKKAMACLKQFGEGNFEAELEKFPGKKAFINDTIELVRKNLKALVSDTDSLVHAAVEGKLATRADTSKHQGDFRKIVQGFNDTLDAVIGPLNFSAGYVDRISKGDIPPKITDQYNGDFNLIKINLNQCIDAVSAMVADAVMLGKAAVEGKLATRADASKHQGDYRKIVEGVNQTLDAVIGPLNFSASYVDRISKGDIPPKITDQYNGDFNLIKNNLNQCIDAVDAMVADAVMLGKAAVEGKLATRADASKHQGDYRKIVEGVNETLDAVIGPLNFSAGYVDRISKGDIPPKITDSYNGDFNLIKNNLNHCIDAVNAMVADAVMLSKAAVEGKLETRADASKHQGDYRKIVGGVNETLDAVIGPLQDVSGVLNKLAGGDFTALVTSKYAGDFDLLANAVNTLSKSVRSALEQIGQNVSALASASEELNKVSQSMGSSADETATQASVVSAAAEQVSNNVQTVATGADEMGASIKEIAKNTAEATRVASSAVRTAEATNETISKLGQSSAEIGQVIKVITSIAQQTNLLALNATIEAARAGEAGKGFAVVANEVKELAKETAKATEDISRKIEAIQTDTNGAVLAIGQISQVIGQISDIQTTIASAIEEQSATTNEIGRTLAEASKGSTDISKNIGGVAEAARATTVGATDTSKSAHSLEKMAAELRTLVSQFRY